MQDSFLFAKNEYPTDYLCQRDSPICSHIVPIGKDNKNI